MRIVAFLKKPRGRGSLRFWYGFIFDTDIQSYVEDFLIFIHLSSYDYFLESDKNLTRPTESDNVHPDNWFYEGRLSGRHLCMLTEVKVKNLKSGLKFEVK